MKPVTRLIALACAGVLVPAALPDAVVAHTPAAATTPTADHTITIANQQAFDAAFAPNGALAKVSAQTPVGTVRQVVLRLANGRYQLPRMLNVPRVHLTLTSEAEVDPVGVAHTGKPRPKAQGATLFTPADEDPSKRYSVLVRTPLTISNAHIENTSAGFATFEAAADVSIINTNVYATDGLFSAPKLVEVVSDTVAPTIEIRDSSIDGILPLRVYKTQGKTVIAGNTITNQPSSATSIVLTLGTGHRPTNVAPDTHVIRNNRFSQSPYNTAIEAGRPGITIDHNEFVLTSNGKLESVAIDPGYAPRYPDDPRPKLTHIAVTYNRFTGVIQPAHAVGLELWKHASLDTKSVTISGNDFSGIKIAVNALIDWVNDNPVVFRDNYVGSATNKLKPATVQAARTSPPAGAGIQPSTPPPVTPPTDTPSTPAPSPPVFPPLTPPPTPPVTNPPSVQPPVVQPPVGTPNPSATETPKPTELPTVDVPRYAQHFAGDTRFETAATIARSTTNPSTSVIVARHDVAADSVSAVPLAKHLGAPIVLTQPDQLHPVAAATIATRLPKGGTVIVMGGDAAISPQVAKAITDLGVHMERIAGPNRAATAVATAQRLDAAGKAKRVLIADGQDWQPDLVAGPAAAAVDGVTLLTNGAAIAPETAAYLAEHPKVPITAIGATAAKTADAPAALRTSDPTALSVAVAKHFFTAPHAVGVATTEDFADALAGGAYIAQNGGPLLLTPKAAPEVLTAYTKSTRSIQTVLVFGGPQRLPSATVTALLLQ